MSIYLTTVVVCICFIVSVSCIRTARTANLIERTTASTPPNVTLEKKEALNFLTRSRVKRSLWEECVELYGCSVGDVYSYYGYRRDGLAYEYMSRVLCNYVTCPTGYKCTWAYSGSIYHIRDLRVRCILK